MVDGNEPAHDEELVDYEEDENQDADGLKAADEAKKGYVGAHSTSFKDFLLKEEILRAITDCGFEHPSEVQHSCIPTAMSGLDVLCQAKSGMGKTAVFVIATLQQVDFTTNTVQALVLCHTRELAFQITHEFQRFGTFIDGFRVSNYIGGMAARGKVQKDQVKEDAPKIVVGTPGRIKAMGQDGSLPLSAVRIFVLDECDKMLDSVDMRGDVQAIFKMCPRSKQVMMFTATLPGSMQDICKKFMNKNVEVVKVDDEGKLTLHGLVQHYIMLNEDEKNRKLNDLLDALDFNQVVVFVKNVNRAKGLMKLLQDCNFPSVALHGQMQQQARLDTYQAFKEGKHRILVATDLIGRGIDIERVNIVINYDMPETDERHGNGADTYLHRVGRAGRFGTKGLAITFVASEEDSAVLNQVQERFDVDIKPLPEHINPEAYMNKEVQ